MLTAAGLSTVRILDGGLPAWRAAGHDLETGAVTPEPGDVTVDHDDLYAGGRPTLTAQQSGAGQVTLLDARPPERFRGGTEPAGAPAGHIPGAKNLPVTAVLADDGSLLGDEAVTELLSDCGIDRAEPVGAYCGSGVSATVLVAALAATDRDAALYPGSWSEWSSDPARPTARGPE